MRHLFAVLAVLGLTPAVSAQAQSMQITNCQPNIVGMPSAGVRCQTSGGISAEARAPAPVYSWRDVPPAPCSTLERMRVNTGNMCEARLVATARKKVGDLIGEGKCDEALKGALGTGDLAFAKEVREFCATKSAEPSGAAP